MKTDLMNIPYVGVNTKKSLIKMGITCIEDLKGKNPYELYLNDCKIKNCKVDKCQLYLFRMAVYYAEHTILENEKLKWWYWKDKKHDNEI